jgi:glyoxylase-like metal-dependent hydrolase (beta-lactamase superfamily II)
MVKYDQIIKGLNIRPKIGFFGYSSVTLIKDGSENILFDTGGYGVRERLFNLKKEIDIHKVFISHLHFDHCANMCLFTDIPVYIHQDELSSLSNNDGIYTDIYDFIQLSISKLNVVAFTDEDSLSENTKIRLTPGHTIGHSSLEVLDQERKTIIAGDAIETYQEYLDPEYPVECFDGEKYRKSYSFIKENYSIIIPGHGSLIDVNSPVENTFELKTF